MLKSVFGRAGICARVVLTALVAMAALAAPSVAFAQSAGCSAISGLSGVFTVDGVGNGTDKYTAQPIANGEIVTYSWSGNTKGAYVYVLYSQNGGSIYAAESVEDATAVSGSGSFTFSNTSAGDFFEVGVNDDNLYNTSTNPAARNSAVNITVSCSTPPTPPTVSAVFNASPISLGSSRQLQITITNPNSVALSGVSLAAAALPANMTGSTPATNCTGATASYSAGAGPSLSGGTLAAGASCLTTLTVTPTANGNYTYTTGVVSAAGVTGTTATTGVLVVTQRPTVTAVAPTAGPAAGGTSVVITGTNFAALSGINGVKFGGVNATSYVVNSTTQVTAVSPAGSAGTVDITVTNNSGASLTSAADQYTYIAAPTITSVSPIAGPSSGGTTVTITGTDFTNVSAVTFGATAATGFTFNSATSITATAPAGTGVVDVRVTTPGGTSATSAADRFTYIVPPTVTSVSPTAGPTAGGTTVAITGTNFVGATAVTFGGTAAAGWSYNNATSITAIAPAGTGTVDIRVTTLGGTSATSAADQFTYVTAPTVTSLSRTSGPTGGGATVVITGTGFAAAAGTGAVKFGATNATYTINSNTQITATSPANSAGTYDVTVTTMGGTSATSAADQFTYVTAPTVTSVSPTSGPTGGGQTVTITGTGFAFAPGTGAVKFGAASATYTINSNTQITATSPANSAGTYDITVTTPGGTSATSAADQYTYIAAPTVTSVSPTSGPTSGGTTVTITGAGFAFAPGTGAVKFGATTATYTINSNTQITATSPANSAGTYDITVATPGGTSATSAADQYTYIAPPVASSQTYGAIVAYNEGANQTTTIPVYLFITGGGTPTSFAVGSATTAQGGSVSIDSSGSATYTPPVGFRNANDSFTYTATNAGGTSAPATVTITVGNPTLTIALPSATGTVERVYNAGGAAITVSGGRAAYTINSISGLPSGLIDAGGGVISGAPAANGTFTVNVNVTDSSLGAGPYTTTATATLMVNLPPAPVVSSFSITGLAYNSGSATATTFSAAPHSTESPTGYQVGASSYGATVSVNSAGLMSYTPPVGFRGTDTFNYVSTNSGGTSNVGQVFVTVDDPIFAITLPASTGTVGEVYNSGSSTVTVTGGNAPYNNFSATGLPAGLTMDSSGVISGTPTTATNATVVVTVTDSSGGNGSYTSTASASLNIAAPTITLSPSSGALPGAQVGVAYSQTFTSMGGVTPISYAVTAGALPPGLTLAATGEVTGAPTTIGTYNFTITGTDSSGNNYAASESYSITAVTGAQTISFGALSNVPPSSSPLTLSATASSGLPVSFASTTINVCTVSGASVTLLQLGTCSITASQAGDGNWTAASDVVQSFTVIPDDLTITANPASGLQVGGAYSQANPASGGVAPYSYRLTAGAFVPGTTVDSTTGVVSGTPTVAGSFSYIIGVSDGQGTPDTATTGVTTVMIAKGDQTLAFTSTPSTALVGEPDYTVSATATSGLSVTYTLDGSSTGCSLSGNTVTFTDIGTCVINANQAGDYNWNAAARVQQSFAVTANPPTVTNVSGVTVGFNTPTPIDLSGSISGVRSSIAVVAGPSHGSVSISGEVVTYTPATNYAGTDSFTWTATGVGGTSNVGTVSLTVSQGAQTISFGALSDASLSASPLTLSATASSGLAVTFFSDTAATCTVSGTSLTLLQMGTCTIRAEQAGDASWAAAPSVSQSFAVTPANLTIAATAATGLQVGGAYSQANTAAGGLAPYTYQLTAGAFVPGTTVNASTGVVSGTPTVAGTFSYIIGVSDGQSPAVTATTGVTTVTIAKGDQTLSFTSTAPSAVVAGPTYTPTVTATSGLAVQFTLDGTSTGCALSGGSVTFTSPGTCVINANQAGDSNWNAATQVQQSFTIVANPPIVADRTGISVPYDSSGTAIDLSVAITGGAHDAITIVTGPAHGTVSVSGDEVTYTPVAGYFGPDSFTYSASGPGGVSGVATVSLTVATPAAPTATGVSGVAVGYNSAGVAIDLSSSVSGVHSAIAVASGPAHGTVSVAGDVVTYVPTANYYGADSFTFTATGPGGTSAPATVALTVANPPAPVIDTPTSPVVVPTPPAGNGPSQPVVVSLTDYAEGVIDGFRITVTSQHGTATITTAASGPVAQAQIAGSGPQSAPGDYQLVYTPAANFMGTDTVTVVAFGPGGDSTPVTFTFQVAGKAPDLSGSVASNAAITFTPTTTLVGGPFQALRITRAPAFGTATVNGLSIVFNPGVANGGSTSLDYVIDLPFGSSAAGRIDLVSNLVPGSQALTATTVQGRAVTTRISDVAGGPFTGAAVVSISPTTAGTATIAGAGGAYDLTFTPTGTFSGVATVTFTLTNPFGTSTGALAVTVEARPDPAQDAEVRGVATSQVTSARRFADAQIGNFQRRLQALHDGDNQSSNGMSLNLGFGAQNDADNDPRAALRRQLSGGRETVDPDAIGLDREREMLGLDVWAGRPTAPDAVASGVDRLSAVPSASETARRSALGFWTAGSVDWGRQDAQGQRDYRFTTQGVTAGLDMRVSDQLIIGGGLGYGEDKTKIGDNGSVSNGKGLTGALYASWRPAEAFYVDGVVGWSDLDFDSRRWAQGLGGQPDAFAEGERSGDTRFLSAAFGRILRGENVTSEFYARVDARSISLDGFTETGAGISSLAWDAVDQDSVSGNLGAAIRWQYEHTRYGLFRPTARIEWSHEFEDIGDQGVRYADWAASPTYLVPLDAWSRNTLRLDLGADWTVNDRLMLGLGYRAGFGDAGSTHGGEIRVKLDW